MSHSQETARLWSGCWSCAQLAMEELGLTVWPGRRQKRMLTFLRDVDKHPECHSSEVACVCPWVQCVPAETSFKLPLGLPEYQCLRVQIIAFPSRAVLRTEASQKHSVLTMQAPQACEHLRSHLLILKSPQINVGNPRQDFLPSCLSVYRCSSARQPLDFLAIGGSSFPDVSSFWVLIHSKQPRLEAVQLLGFFWVEIFSNNQLKKLLRKALVG